MEEITSAPSTPTAAAPAVAAKVSAAVTTPSTSSATNVDKGTSLEFDPSLSEDERRFYMKAYPSIDLVRERKVHCTICKCHIGTAPSQESSIKMHPVLRVTQCTKCHDFYNSGEFSKGEDGSELYCRWCGQGGEVYCCSNCPYVFCKSCIVKNLSRGVVADIEQNENWSCFNCAPKILWPLRAQHWALINYIDKQKKTIQSQHISESEMKQQMAKDRSTCCRLAKSKCGNMSDSLESIDSVASKRSLGSSSSAKKAHKLPVSGVAGQLPAAKRAKTSNDVVVCTPDLMSMLEPDCQITVSPKQRPPQSSPATSSPKVISIQSSYTAQTSTPVHNTAPPPLVLRNTGIQLRHPSPAPIIRRTVVGPRTPNSSGGSSAPVYHTINGYRIDLNSAAQQETFRLPNGKLIQVKRQGTQQSGGAVGTTNMSPNNWQQRTPGPIIQHGARPVQITHASPQSRYITVQHSPSAPTSGPNYAQQQQLQHQQLQHQPTQVVRYHNTMVGNTSVTAVGHNGSGAQIQLINGAPQATAAGVASAPTARTTPAMVRHVFPDTAIGQARTQLQDQVFNAMEICQHLTGKIQTLTNSNAYKQARNYLEVKELYIHLSYLLTYAIGRFKGLQDKCLGDMRQLGFVNDADSLENGQLAADKQASDDEDNEIEIVEPKTDTITLDSDNEDEPPTETKPVMSATTNAMTTAATTSVMSSNVSTSDMDDMDFRTAAQSILASMLEVDLFEGDPATALSSPAGSDQMQKKQPRKKTTHKPNPTLIKQKEMLERERLEEMKKNDLKLKMKCAIELKKAEEEYPFAKEMLEEKEAEMRKETESTLPNGAESGSAIQKEQNEMEAEKDKEESDEVVVMLVDDDLESSTEEEKDKLKECNDEMPEKNSKQLKQLEENIIPDKHKEETKNEKMGDINECKENTANNGKAEIEDKNDVKAITKNEDEHRKEKEENDEVRTKLEDEQTEAEKEDEDLIREALGEKASGNTSKEDGEDEELIREALEQKGTNAQNLEKKNEKEEKDDIKVLATVKNANTDNDDEMKEENKTKENKPEANEIENTERMEVDEPTSTYKMMEVGNDRNVDKTQVNERPKISAKKAEAKVSETPSEKQLVTASDESNKTNEETIPTNDTSVIQENQINSDESELDVDKEIEKLLQNKSRQKSIDGESDMTTNTEDEEKLSVAKDFHDVLALGSPSTARRSTTPGLFNDIKELIEKESNSAT